MRIGLVVTGGVDRSGTARVTPALLAFIERLARRHEVHVFALHQYVDPCTYTLLGATVHDLGRVRVPRGFGRLAQYRRLRTALSAVGHLDLLHAFQGVPSGDVATRAAADADVPCVVTMDSGEWMSLPEIGYGLQRHWWDRRAVARTARRAARVTVCTDFMQNLARHHGVAAEVIPLGVPPPAARTAARDEGPPWRLIHVASINAVKDHATLLHAMALVAAEEPRVHLDVIGEDTLGGQAQQLAARLGLTDRVTFRGFQTTDVVMTSLARAHLHVVSSRHEAAGVTVLEAALAGTSTVGTAVGYIADGAPSRAVSVPVADPVALSAAVIALLRDRSRREQLAVAAMSWAAAHDADATVNAFERVYSTLNIRP